MNLPFWNVSGLRRGGECSDVRWLRESNLHF